MEPRLFLSPMPESPLTYLRPRAVSVYIVCFLLVAVDHAAGHERPATRAYDHDFEAVVLRQGQRVRLPSPLYVVDVYMGGWNEYDQRQHPRLDLGSKTWFVSLFRN